MPVKLFLSRLIFVVILNLPFDLWAAIPTMEGLFRNVSNPDPSGDMIMVALEVNALETNPVSENRSNDGHNDNEVKGNRPLYIKLVYNLIGPGVKLLQVVYDDLAMSDNKIRSAKLINNFPEFLSADNKDERRFIHGLLSMFVLNRSLEISQFLKKVQPEFKLNQDLLNNEKVKLYNRYRQFLLAGKKSNSKDDLGLGPIKSDDPVRQQEIDRILKSSMYNNVDQVKLVREEGRFFWKLDLNSVTAYFTQNTQQMKNLMVQTQFHQFKVEVENYALYDGVHELPSSLIFELGGEKKLQVSFQKLSHFNNKGPDINARLVDYQKKIPSGKGMEEGKDHRLENYSFIIL